MKRAQYNTAKKRAAASQWRAIMRRAIADMHDWLDRMFADYHKAWSEELNRAMDDAVAQWKKDNASAEDKP